MDLFACGNSYIPEFSLFRCRHIKYEKFSDDAIAYAIENIKADWKENAVRTAKDYLEFSPMSKDELYEQLIYEKYTEEEARYAVEEVY